jgi:hypothetical protein
LWGKWEGRRRDTLIEKLLKRHWLYTPEVESDCEFLSE